jgi:hypothetical protein
MASIDARGLEADDRGVDGMITGCVMRIGRKVWIARVTPRRISETRKLTKDASRRVEAGSQIGPGCVLGRMLEIGAGESSRVEGATGPGSHFYFHIFFFLYYSFYFGTVWGPFFNLSSPFLLFNA